MGFAIHSAANPGLVAVAVKGNFGYTGLPYMFEVITRILRACIGIIIVGLFLIYVDDTIVVTTRAAYRADRDIVHGTIRKLLGDRALAVNKSECTEVEGGDGVIKRQPITAIGWLIDLNRRTADMSLRSRAKLTVLFKDLASKPRITLHEAQQVCSLAERYSLVYAYLRGLMALLYSMLGGTEGRAPDSLVAVSPAARMAMQVWEAHLHQTNAAASLGRPTGRPIRNIANANVAACVAIEFDGSLEGLGARLLDRPRVSAPGIRPDQPQQCTDAIYLPLLPTFFPNADPTSSHQNATELSAMVIGLVHAVV
jgi:hypothetical protein